MWAAGTKRQQQRPVSRCGGGCRDAAGVLSPGVAKTTGGAGGRRRAACEGANGTRIADGSGCRR
eukprot:1721947-Prymnesium_polylepis.1